MELKLQDSVIFTGWVEDTALSRIVASCWLNIHSSTTEGWGLSIIEASSTGTPTVAYDVPGVMESIENGRNGIRVENGNRNALAEAALTILSNPGKWQSSSIEVSRKYSWDRTANMWEDLINKVVKDSGKPSKKR